MCGMYLMWCVGAMCVPHICAGTESQNNQEVQYGVQKSQENQNSSTNGTDNGETFDSEEFFAKVPDDAQIEQTKMSKIQKCIAIIAQHGLIAYTWMVNKGKLIAAWIKTQLRSVINGDETQ